MDARRTCPLFLLLLVWTFPPRVLCQELTANLVFTRYVEVSWPREVEWMGVEEFEVQFTAEGSNSCSETIECQSVNCSFSSLLCGVVAPCTPTTTTVTGGGYSAQLSLVTGPEEVTDLDMYLAEGVEYFSWVNPSINSSTCHEKTAVKVSISGRESISYLDNDEEEAEKPLCIQGTGQVEVWTLGGDGRSKSVLESFLYTDLDDVVDLVTFEKCEPVGCTDMALEWTYNPLCPEVAYLQVAVDGDVQKNVSTNDTNVTVTGLEVGPTYPICIHAIDKDGIQLFSACQFCAAAAEVPENLAAQPLRSKSLHVTWDPPLCPKDSEKLQYLLSVGYRDYYTYATTYEATGLSEFYEYEVVIGVFRGHFQAYVTTTAFTLAPQPDLYYPYVNKDNIELSWYFYVRDDHDYEFYFKVTWGKSLEHEGETTFRYYTIEDYGSIDDVHQVCVAAVPRGRENLTSEADCRFVFEDTYRGLSGGAIAGIVCGVVAFVLVVAVVTVSITKKRKEARRRQQQQQQQLQERYNQGDYNYGANI